jgi:hypothetical protein
MLAAAWEGLITRVETQRMGQDSLFGLLACADDPIELIVRVMFTADDQETLKTAVRRAMALGLSGPAGMSVSVSRSAPIRVRCWASADARARARPWSSHVGVTGRCVMAEINQCDGSIELAYGRSGDKATSPTSVIARSPSVC